VAAILNQMWYIPIRFNHWSGKLSVDEEYVFRITIRSSFASADSEVVCSNHAKINEHFVRRLMHITHPVFGRS
jgi:hypothetical protein